MEYLRSTSFTQQLNLFPDKKPKSAWLKHGSLSLALHSLDSAIYCSGIIYDYLSNNPDILDRIHSSSAILIKPNITSGELPERGRTSNPLILKAVLIDLFTLGINSSKIIVADSSVIGTNTSAAAKVAGIIDICDKFNVNFMDINEGPFLEIKVDQGLRNRSIWIHEFALNEHIFKINLAKVKTTYGSPIGFCIKNLKGLISNDNKLAFHINGVQESLVDLRNVITCDLNILEGFPASELGSPIECNIIGISIDDILLDCIMSEIIGINYKTVPHLNILSNANNVVAFFLPQKSIIGFIDSLPSLEYAKHGIDDLSKEFNIDIIDCRPCTACLESFYKALYKLRKNEQIPIDFSFVLGPWHVNADHEFAKDKSIVFIGACALAPGHIGVDSDFTIEKQIENMQNESNNVILIPGCPPTIDSMVIKLSKLRTSQLNIHGTYSCHSLEGETSSKNIQSTSTIRDWLQTLPIQNAITASVIPKVIGIVPREEVDFSDLGVEIAVQCELITASICQRMNWDFLRNRIKECARIDPDRWSFNRIKDTKSNDILELLHGYKKTDMVRAEERANMLRELGSLFHSSNKTFLEILENTDHCLDGPNGLIALLIKLNIFNEDPEMKKIQVLIHSLLRSNLWNFYDEENINPAVDYHIMRLHIRRGNIWHRTQQGKLYLRANVRRRSSTTNYLRSLVSDAIKMISSLSGCSIIDINGAEWWIGRSLCHHGLADCFIKEEENKWLKSTFLECPYKTHCYSWLYDTSLLTINEPRDNSRFY